MQIGQLSRRTAVALTILVWIAPGAESAIPVYVPVFQQTADAGTSANAAAFLAFALRVKLAQIPGVQVLERAPDCGTPGPAVAAPDVPISARPAAQGLQPNIDAKRGGSPGSDASEGTFYQVMGTLELHGTERGTAADVFVTYSLSRREGCRSTPSSKGSDTYQFPLSDLLDGFGVVSDKVSTMLKRDVQPRRTVVEVLQPRAADGAASMTGLNAMVQRYLIARFAGSDTVEVRLAGGTGTGSDFRLQLEYQITQQKAGTSVQAQLRIFDGAGKAQPVQSEPVSGITRTKDGSDLVLVAIEVAARAAKDIDALRAAKAAGVLGDDATSVSDLLEKARGLLCRTPDGSPLPGCAAQPKEALAVLLKIPQDTINKAELSGQASLLSGDQAAATASFRTALNLAGANATRRRVTLLRELGDSRYADSDYETAAQTYQQYSEASAKLSPSDRELVALISDMWVRWSHSLLLKGKRMEALNVLLSADTQLKKAPEIQKETSSIIAGLSAAELPGATDRLIAVYGATDPLSGIAMSRLGGLAEDAKDYTKAVDWFRRAAAAGDGQAMYRLGWLYNAGRGVPQDYVQAREWYQKASDLGIAGAATSLGVLYYYGDGVPLDYLKALDFYKIGANRGDSAAMLYIGYLYHLARGVPLDYAQARDWYQKAADLGNMEATDELAFLYEKGYGVPLDTAAAIRLYTKAAAGGNSTAMEDLGRLYRYGIGVTRDLDIAKQWYEKGATAGNAGAMLDLGYLAETGKDYVSALNWYKKSVEAGSAGAMTNLGYMYLVGEGTPVDYNTARSWLEKSAAGGDGVGMRLFGYLYENGNGVARDYGEARKWYEKAADLKDAHAMDLLGHLYEKGNGVSQSYATAGVWWEKAAAAGDSHSMTDLGYLYAYGRGVSVDYAKAREWYEKASAAKDAVATRLLGYMYDVGQGVPVDYEHARKLYEQAVDLGDTYAMDLLGYLYRQGLGVPVDLAAAKTWYEKGAAAGDEDAMYNLGNLYEAGRGVAKDYALAIEWYQKAADRNSPAGTRQLGYLYQFGYGAPIDLTRARQLYEKAAGLKDATAMFRLGYLYEEGVGVRQNLVQARDWYRQGAEGGDAGSMVKLADFFETGEGGPKDLAAARNWLEMAAAKGDQEAKDRLAATRK